MTRRRQNVFRLQAEKPKGGGKRLTLKREELLTSSTLVCGSSRVTRNFTLGKA
jgi:hypothetical protein